MFRIQGLGCSVWGLGFRVQSFSLGCRVPDLGTWGSVIWVLRQLRFGSFLKKGDPNIDLKIL